MKKRKIVLMGLIGLNNYGDNFIANCVAYLLNDREDIQTYLVDMESQISFCRKICYYIVLLLSKVIPFKICSSHLEYWAVKIRCKKTYMRELKTADGLIFAVGSFKYGTQKVWAYYSLATEIANEFHIPVMFNAMNIQAYDGKNWKCEFLREHANLPCVKMITSRDGDAAVGRLYEDYKIRRDIVCAGVGDSAFWISQCYGIQKKENCKSVGINLIYGNIFVRYGKSLNSEKLLIIYNTLLRRLDRNGISWELFTNGLPSDYEFGVQLLRQYGEGEHTIYVPSSDRELIEHIAGYSIILGARLHACICAYALDIPFVGFIWDEKLLSFSKMTETESHFISEEELNGDSIFDLLYEFYIHPEAGAPELKEKWKNKTRKTLYDFLEYVK